MLKKPLRIGMVAPVWAPVPTTKYGGTENIVSILTEALVERGHTVTLFASGDSKTKARLISVTAKNLLARGIPFSNTGFSTANVAEAFTRASQFDVIHTHVQQTDLFFPALTTTPVLHTIHNDLSGLTGSIDTQVELELYAKYNKNNFVSISKNQKKRSLVPLHWVATIYHGINLNQFTFYPKPQNHFVWAARLNPRKGPDIALRAAGEAGKRVFLAGPRLTKKSQDFYKQTLSPLIHQYHGKFVGEISQKQKSSFFGPALGLLYPIKWEEPFGLVMIEAMACGTPVIAFQRGAAPELIVNGKTGYIVRTFPEMVRAIKKIHLLDRAACRAHVEKYFSAERMVNEYEELYYELLSRQKVKGRPA